MEIGDLRYLVASADAGSFARAAIMLSRNASTLSRRVGRLENELGLPLFERSHSGVRLTSAGKVVLVHVRRALAEIDAIKVAGLQSGAAAIGEVRLGVRMPPIGEGDFRTPGEMAGKDRSSISEWLSLPIGIS